MKKRYITPVSSTVQVKLLGTVLDNEGATLGGQTFNPVDDNVDRGGVDWSAKKQKSFDDEDDETWGNLWQ